MSQHHTNPPDEASNTYAVQINPTASVVELVGESHYWTPAETWDLADAITFARACETSLEEEGWRPSEDEGWTRHMMVGPTTRLPTGGPIGLAEAILLHERQAVETVDPPRPPESIPTDVQVTLVSPTGHPLPTPPVGRRRTLPQPEVVDQIQYRAHNTPSGVSVVVTLFARANHRSYYLNPEAVAADLNTGPPPAWVPAAPTWFNVVVNQMRRNSR